MKIEKVDFYVLHIPWINRTEEKSNYLGGFWQIKVHITKDIANKSFRHMYFADNDLISNMNRLRITQREMERAMLGVSLRDHKTNTWIRQKTRVTDVIQKTLKWSFAVHLAKGRTTIKDPGKDHQ